MIEILTINVRKHRWTAVQQWKEGTADRGYNTDEPQHHATWKKPVTKDNTLQDSSLWNARERQNLRATKQITLGMGERSDCRQAPGIFWVTDMFCNWILVILHNSFYLTKNHGIVHLKSAKSMLCKLYLKKAAKIVTDRKKWWSYLWNVCFKTFPF